MARQSSSDDFGRMLIQTVLQAGSNAFQQYAEEEDIPISPQAQNTRSYQNNAAQSSLSLQSLLGGTLLDTWKEELKTEFEDYVAKLSDKASKSVLKRLDRDGEIRIALQKNMQMLEILAWCLVAYLFAVTIALLIGMAKLMRANRRLLFELRNLQSSVEVVKNKL